MSRISSSVIFPLCSGAHQFGVRWKTVQVTDGFGDLLDCLHRSRAGTDDPNPLAGEIDAFLGPAMSVAGQAFERIDAGDVGQRRRGENADRSNQEAG